MHAARLRRHGSVDLPARPDPRRLNSNGYRVVSAQDHPVAHSNGYAFEHRVVLYDAIGPGSHPCHWCSAVVTWGQDLQADHVDHNTVHNTIDNLVPSCAGCNVRRNRRWANKSSTCSAGHDFTAENTYVIPRTGARQCRVCSRQRKSEYKKRNVGPCRGCGRLGVPRGASTAYCPDCASDPLRAARTAPDVCGKGHALAGDNLVFVRANSRSDRMRWRCQQCTREKSYEAYLKRRAVAS
jgi:hypothetical protein